MDYTTDNLAAINAAIASGALSVEFEGRKIMYRSMTDLLKAKAVIEDYLDTQAGAVPIRQYRIIPNN